MGTRDFDVKKLLNDKKFWLASFLIGWAAALQVSISTNSLDRMKRGESMLFILKML